MKIRIAAYMLSAILLFSAAGCAQSSAQSESSVQFSSGGTSEPLSSSESESAAEPDLSSESSGVSDADAETPDDGITMAEKIFTDFDSAKDDPYLVYADSSGVLRLELVEELISAIKQNEQKSIAGFMYGYTVPIVFELAYEPDSLLTYTQYIPLKEGVQAASSAITAVYETELFFYFTNFSGTYFSISKVSSAEEQPVEGYQPGSDLDGALVTASQAVEAANQIRSLLYGYIAHTNENDLGNPMSAHGLFIPDDYSDKAEQLVDTGLRGVAEGAASISGELFYLISFYDDNGSLQDAYYINAQDSGLIYSISMADGGLSPISYGVAEQVLYLPTP